MAEKSGKKIDFRLGGQFSELTTRNRLKHEHYLFAGSALSWHSEIAEQWRK